MRINKKRDYLDNVITMILFAFAISLFDLAGYIYSALVVGLFMMYSRQIKITMPAFLLIGFSCSYFLFYTYHNSLSLEHIIIFLFGPWTAYIIGRVYVEQRKVCMKLVLLLASGMFFHGILNTIAYVRSEHYASYEFFRRSVDFWRGKLVNVNVTGMYFVFAVGISIGILFTTLKRAYKIWALVVLGISISITMFFANRSLLVIVVLLIGWGIVWWNRSFGKVSWTKLLLFIGIFAVGLVGIVILVDNLWGSADWVLSLKIVQRLSGGNVSGRTHVWAVFLQDFNFLKYPFGGKMITEASRFNYLHNLWLDIYNVAGVIPFLLFVIFCIYAWSMFMQFKQVMDKHNRRNEYIIMLFLFLAIILNCAVEPIVEANPYYFLIVLMLLGAVEGTVKSYRR